MKKFFSWVLIAVMILTVSVPLYAKNLTDLKKQRSTIKNDAASTKKLLEDTKEQKSQATREVDAIDIELNEVAEALDIINEQFDKTSQLLEKTEKELNQAEIDKELQYEVFKKRIRFMYENGKVGYMEIAFQAKDFSDFLNRVEYINRIVEYDNNVANKLQQTEDLITVKLEETTTQKLEVQTLAEIQKSKKYSLEQTLAKKKEIIKKIDADEKKYAQQIKDLEVEDKNLERLIVAAQAAAARAAAARAAAQATANTATKTTSSTGALKYTGGKIGLPVPGGSFSINSGYGNRTHPISGKKEFHTGIDLKASLGSNIIAAEGGTVIKSGWSNGYGYTVIVDHGGGLSTLYAHNSKLLVSEGSSVSKGEVISKAGSTGYSTGPHLHFEVRFNGRHQNPKDYINY